jgi:cobyrinic acid a,c-diamide synthase
MNYPRIIIAATNSGAGKTTVALGIMLALRRRGLAVQPFKAGPDYIDTTYHTRICKNAARNLDTWLLKPEAVLELFERQARKADISVVEAVMGLYDGFSNGEEGSSAHLAKLLGLPVILVINAASISRSAAAIALGYKTFDRKVHIAGIILNNIGNSRHYVCVKSAIEKSVRIPVLGFLPKDNDLIIPQRHLGLIPVEEKKLTKKFYKALSNLTEKNIDIDAIIKISRLAKPFGAKEKNIFNIKSPKRDVTIAIAYDKAFNFYYQDNLDILKALGARLVPFSPLKDKTLPPGINGLYLGGGFPELFAEGLSKNISLKDDLYRRVRQAMPVYAECGGLMYLVKRLIDFRKRAFPMVGIFGPSAIMGKRLQGLGYVEIEVIRDNVAARRGERIRAHTFHWSYLDGELNGAQYAYRISKNKDKVYYDGLTKDNVLAGYCHLHFASNLGFAKNFIESCRVYEEKDAP